MRCLICVAFRRTSRPRTSIEPASGWWRPSIISIVVVLPAPFGPRRPKISPVATSKLTPSTALTAPYALRTSPTRMTASPAAGCGAWASASTAFMGPPDCVGSRAARCPCRPSGFVPFRRERARRRPSANDGRSASSARSASCLPEPLGHGLQHAAEEDRGRRAQVALAPLRRLLVEVLGELALERPADLLAVRPELLERLLDLRREHRLRQVRLRPEDRLPDALEHPLRAAEQQERRAARRPEHLRRLAPEACRDVDRSATRGLEADELLVEAGARG